MTEAAIAGGVLAGIGVVLWGTGWWRRGLGLFGIKPETMTVEQLKLGVKDPADVGRINQLLASFAGGFNKMLAARSASACRNWCDSLPALYRPFAHEGMAMGYAPRHLFRYNPSAFEERVVKPGPEFRYLYYVGLGFWSGMRHYGPQRLAHVVRGLDPLHGYLCYDGYGFKQAFFDYRDEASVFGRLDALDGYARNAAYQGAGRAFYFLYMDEPEQLIAQILKQRKNAADVAGGVGLASVFIYPDRLEVARELAERMPESLRDSFHLGMCFGLKARSINDREQFERDLASQERCVQEAAFASVRECDRIELLVRSQGREDAYRQWRELVTEWMAGHIQYPLAGVVSVETHPLTGVSASR